jgi:uncharacterized protein (TIGR03067 family)
MKTRILALGALGLLVGGMSLLIAANDDIREAGQKDRELYQGTWRVTALEADGTTMAADDCARVTVLNEMDGKWIVKLEGAVIWQGVSTIDPTKTPKTIDFRPTEGADVGKIFFGIYELGKETRRLCYAESGKERPTEFSTKNGSGQVLVIFKRERPIALLTKP